MQINQKYSKIFICKLLSLFLLFISIAGADSLKYEISNESARLRFLELDDVEIPLSNFYGGFDLYDVTNNESRLIELSDCNLTLQGETSIFEAEANDLTLTVEFTPDPNNNYIVVNGVIENSDGLDRACILSYLIGIKTDECFYSNGINDSNTVNATTVHEQHIYPIACLGKDPNWAVTIAIPPTSPCIFSTTCGPEGVGLKMYLGMSPDVDDFPDTAHFRFIIYSADPEWKFRSALNKYYSFSPDYYDVVTTKDGLWMCHLEDDILPNIYSFGFDELGISSSYTSDALARDEYYDILSIPYIIAGQRQIYDVNSLPTNYEEAIGILDDLYDSGTDPELCEIIYTSTCEDLNNEFYYLPRCVDDDNRLAFKLNPNPDIDPNCVGNLLLDKVEDILNDNPEVDGIYVDSLGAQWPALLNYNTDHFAYARDPLTFDIDGNLALHNTLSHYAFLEDLKTMLRADDKVVMGNGIYIYDSDTDPAEHYHPGAKLGRFFMASLLDIAGCEQGVNLDQQRWEFYRSCMGQKSYTSLNYKWEDDANDVMDLLNKAMLYGTFSTSSTGYYPDGYERDESFVASFASKVRLLTAAGWEPVTNAVVDQDLVLCERYGDANTVYFAVMSENTSDVNCNLTIDLSAIDFTYGNFTADEISGIDPEYICVYPDPNGDGRIDDRNGDGNGDYIDTTKTIIYAGDYENGIDTANYLIRSVFTFELPEIDADATLIDATFKVRRYEGSPATPNDCALYHLTSLNRDYLVVGDYEEQSTSVSSDFVQTDDPNNGTHSIDVTTEIEYDYDNDPNGQEFSAFRLQVDGHSYPSGVNGDDVTQRYSFRTIEYSSQSPHLILHTEKSSESVSVNSSGVVSLTLEPYKTQIIRLVK